MNVKFALAIGVVLFWGNAQAQTFHGIQNSNFAGVHTVYSNPALLTSMAYKRHANVSTIGFEVSNNMFSLTAPFTLWQAITGNVAAEYQNSKGQVQWRSEYLKTRDVGNDGWATVGLEWRGPSYANRLGKRFVWASHSRTRSSLMLKNISNGTLSYAKVLFDSAQRGSKFGLNQLSPYPINFQANAYQEIGASLAFAIVDAKKLKISVGATAKYLMGLGHVSLISDGIQLKTYGRDSVSIIQSNAQIAYSESQVLQRMLSGIIVGGLPSFRNILGNGVGFDFGVSVEGGKGSASAQIKERWLGDPKARNYKWRLAASVLDWGQVSYGNNVNSFSISNSTPVTLKTDSAFFGAFAKGSAEGFQYLETFAKSNLNYSATVVSQKVVLPTQIQLQGDMRLKAGFYAAFQWQQSLISAKIAGFRQPSSIVVVPRFESKWLEVSMPVGLTQDYRKGNIGACVRVGPLFVGSDNLLSNLIVNQIKGMNVYFGLSSSIGKTKK